MRFPVNLTGLAMRMMNVVSTISLLQDMGILPLGMACNTCSSALGPYATNHNYHYFECSSCKTKTSILSHTVLSNSNTKLREFVILMYLFCTNHRTYNTVRKEAHVEIEGYKDVHLSSSTINKWFGYFRRLCVEDNKRFPMKIGGVGDIVEIDESMCGKLKYGKGDGRKRRRQWIFGGLSRTSGRLFMTPCPDNKRTRKSLWPIIQANIAEGTTIHSDGWRCYRRLGELNYNHRWINHDLHYVDPTDPSLHTNGVEGLWGKFKRWLPSSGKYNLEEYMELFMWLERKKLEKEDPFWALVELVKADNSTETLKKSMERMGDVEDTEGVEYVGEEEVLLEKQAQEDLGEDSDEEDLEKFYFYDCVFCKSIFRNNTDLVSHIGKCRNK